MAEDTSPLASLEQEPRSQSDTRLVRRRSSYAAPPYWQHNRSASYATVASLDRSNPITLKDNTEDDSIANRQLWARSITIDDYVVIKGSSNEIGAYVVWNCKVETLDGGPMIVRKRYSEFDDLRRQLLEAFPRSTTRSLPPLPPKSAIYKFKTKFLEKRREGLAYFLNCVMLNPSYAGSSIVKDFIFYDHFKSPY